ncbi:MAG: TolC family protein [Acidobacteria bacterium]|nr:TolC family protein [Acidobacteriota bacterium]
MFQSLLKAAVSCAVVAAFVVTGTLAQDAPKPAPLPATTPAAQMPAVSRPLPTRTSGLESGKVARWSLRDAIMTALENNADIEIDRSTVRQRQFDITAAEGAYDPVSTQGTSFNSTGRPNTRPFSGLQEGEDTLASKTLVYNFGHQGFIYRTGGSYQVNFNNQRFSSNFALFTAQYDPNLSFSLSQPLWRNYKIDRNRYQIQIAKKQLDLSDVQFRQRAIEVISRVQTAYWNLALAIKDEEVQRDAFKLAETQLSQNQRQVEVGTLAPIDVVQSATVIETRRQQVFQAMEAVGQAENTLKNLTVSGINDELWKTQIVPTESFEAAPTNLPLDDAMKLAIDNRPELKQFALQKEINQTDQGFLRNQIKPQIDFNFSYGTVGTGGAPRNVNTVATQFIGGYGTGLARLFSNQYRQWTAGVQITLPWRNRTAKANLGRSLEVGRQLDLRARQQMQLIETEVRNAVQAVDFAKLRIEASRAARLYAEQQLEGEQKRFAAGLSTTFFVLQRQNELAQARGSELRALADYNRSVAELQRVIATTLSSNSVEVKSEITAQPGDKKWGEIK